MATRKLNKPRKLDLEADSQVFCFFCNRYLNRDQFYYNGNPKNKSHMTPICRSCAKEIAEQHGSSTKKGLTKQSLLRSLRYMDKPFIVDKFTAACDAKERNANNAGITRDVFGFYMSFLQTDPKTKELSWEDGDESEYTLANLPQEQRDTTEAVEDRPLSLALTDEIMEEMEINRRDVIRLIGYDPYVSELPSDKPLLYSKTIGFLDASPDVNEDEMKISSIIEIVKLFNQAEKINTTISALSTTPDAIAENIVAIGNLEATKKNIMTTALNLAKDNAISVAHNTTKSKGSHTFAGMAKKLNELNLREQHVNAFDIETCYGMEQVAQLSNKAILDQINLNENDFPEMILEQRMMIQKWKKVAQKATEQARILLQENLDLKAALNRFDVNEIVVNSVTIDTDGGLNDSELLSDQFQEEVRLIEDNVLDYDGTVTFSEEEVGDSDEQSPTA